jgi:mannose-6-phosphate isomerase-like protein (cupin superfamily)
MTIDRASRSPTYWKQSDRTDLRHHKSMHGGDGVIVRRPFFREQSRLPIKLDVWELAPGVSEGGHTHGGPSATSGDERPLEEIYYFLQGSGILWADGEDVPVQAGDAVLVPPGVNHGFRNTGSEPLRVLLLWGETEEPTAS